jgi:S-adenosylmethionine:tRNA ribosyltransferase-isomerase
MARLSDYDYALPRESIAQAPLEPRDAARLLVHEKARGVSRARVVADLGEELAAGDLLVLNETRVRAARLLGRRASGGRVEFLFLEPLEDEGERSLWRSLVRPAARLKPGEEVVLEDGDLVARAVEREGPFWRVALGDPRHPELGVEALLERSGRAPLPPYIERGEDDPRGSLDRERYQTVFARQPGAAAAPTAGLHFTPRLLSALEAGGIETARLCLHVGLGTFLPISVEDSREHVMHAEAYELPESTVQAVRACRARDGRVVAVGTTCVRVLEACAGADGELAAGVGRTDLFIEPGHEFRVVDALLTNFHLPRSTLLLLVSAFAGRERVLELYRRAITEGYRFYSYGDAMLLLP